METSEFENVVSRNSQRLFLIAFAYTKNRYDAEDIMQNSLLKLWNCNINFENDEHIDKWLTKVCINECKDLFRKIFRVHTVSLDSAENIAVNDKHFDIDLFNAVSSLSKNERLVVHLFYYEDMSIDDISLITKIKQSTVKSLLHRSRIKLKNKLGDEWYNEQ